MNVIRKQNANIIIRKVLTDVHKKAENAKYPESYRGVLCDLPSLFYSSPITTTIITISVP